MSLNYDFVWFKKRADAPPGSIYVRPQWKNKQYGYIFMVPKTSV